MSFNHFFNHQKVCFFPIGLHVNENSIWFCYYIYSTFYSFSLSRPRGKKHSPWWVSSLVTHLNVFTEQTNAHTPPPHSGAISVNSAAPNDCCTHVVPVCDALTISISRQSQLWRIVSDCVSAEHSRWSRRSRTSWIRTLSSEMQNEMI